MTITQVLACQWMNSTLDKVDFLKYNRIPTNAKELESNAQKQVYRAVIKAIVVAAVVFALLLPLVFIHPALVAIPFVAALAMGIAVGVSAYKTDVGVFSRVVKLAGNVSTRLGELGNQANQLASDLSKSWYN